MKKRNFMILRRGNPWKVLSLKDNTYICDYPAYNYDKTLIETICFAKNKEEVIKILNS